jgi:drug/metabolite transporter (DMT)-like permease
MWLLLVPSYLATLQTSAGVAHTLPLPVRLLQYSVCGVITGVITICRNVAVNLLPGSVFALLISTSILFSVVLSKLVNQAQLNLWHYAAVACCLASAMSIALTALLTTQEDVAGSNFPVGIPVALGAALFVAVMGIAQELYQKTWAGPLFELYLAEMTLASSLVASMFVVLFGAAVSEFPTWTGALASAAALSSGAQSLIIGVCAILPVLKLAVRNSKYAVILASSSLFFEFVQASAALISSISSVVAFSEPFGPGFIAAIALLALAFGLYSEAKIEAKKAKDAAAEEARGKGAAPSTLVQVSLPAALAAASPLAAPAAGEVPVGSSVEAWGERVLAPVLPASVQPGGTRRRSESRVARLSMALEDFVLHHDLGREDQEDRRLKASRLSMAEGAF